MSRIIHQIVTCMDCDKVWEEYRGGKAKKAGYAHAKRTGHVVIWETGTGGRYRFPKEVKK